MKGKTKLSQKSENAVANDWVLKFLYDADLRHVESSVHGGQRMAKVLNGIETFIKISTGWVGHTNVADDRETDMRYHIPEHNVVTFR